MSAAPSWNLIFDDFLDQFNNSPIKVTGFADDGCLIARGPDLSALRDLLQEAAVIAADWGARHGLKFSAEKSVSVVFT
jgi:hypothetical protein